jgi:hypothetical protein
MRVNRTNQLAYIMPDMNKKSSGTHIARKRKPGEAASVEFSRLKDPGIYRTGMGDTPAINRPGSEIAFTLPSKGLGT